MLTTPSSSPRVHKWRHSFKGGLSVTATLAANGQLACVWSSRPPIENRGFCKALLKWSRHLTTQAAAILGRRILHVVQTGPDEWTTIVGDPRASAANSAGEIGGPV